MKTIATKENSAVVELTIEELKWLMFLTNASISVSGDKCKYDFSFGAIDSLIESAIYNQNKINSMKKDGFESSLCIHDSAELHCDIKYLIDTLKHSKQDKEI